MNSLIRCLNTNRRRAALSIILALTLVMTTIPTPVSAASKSSSRIKTYVFFGSDSRKNDDSWRSPNGGKITQDKSGTEGIPRSDVIMLLKVDNKKKTIDLLSIYRDTLLDVSGKGTDFQVINRAYSDLGPKKAVKVLEKNLDIKIDGYVATNFKGVANVIDALGGVYINVEKEKTFPEVQKKYKLYNVVQTTNSYINEMNRIYNTKTPHIKKPGKQRLTGLQAVGYARVRYTEGSDRKRTVRQKTVLSSMLSQYKASNAEVKAKALLALLDNVDTDINPATLAVLFKKTAKYKIKKKQGFPYYIRAYTLKTKKERLGVATTLVPCDLTTNVKKLHKSFYGEKKYKPSKTVKKYSKKIVKKTKFTFSKRTKACDNQY